MCESPGRGMVPALADVDVGVAAGATADVCDAGWSEGWSAVLVVSGLWDEMW